MAMHVRSRLWTTLAILASIGILAAQQSEPTLRIASPTDDAIIAGPTRLVAIIEPASAARSVREVIFFADAQQVCKVVRQPFECDWDAGERINPHHIRASAVLRGGGRISSTVQTKGLDITEEVDVDVVQVTAVVTDDDGRFVKGLKQSDFVIYEDDKPQPLSNFASENIPLEMVAAVDVSASMTDALPAVREHAKKFLSGLRPKDQVTLLAFNENMFTLARRSTDQAARERAIDLMDPWGGTALYDTIIRSVELLGRQPGRRAIVLFSDGDDQSSRAPLELAIRKAEGSDAIIYAIGQGRAVRSPELQKLMKQLARVSGGRAFFTEDSERLNTIFEEILEDLRNQYLLGYAAPTSQRDGQWHDIRVKAGKYSVRARQGYRLAAKSMPGH
jgi:Ca-activated chloride channel family protein